MVFRLSKLGGFTLPTPLQYQGTLARALVHCVDQVRDINTQLGLRPYVVRLVHTRWSSGERGAGVEQVISVVPITPIPKIETISALDVNYSSVGGQENGCLRVSQISGRYTEDQLLGRTYDGNPIDEDTNFFYEIEYRGGNGPQHMRRFYVSGAPQKSPGGVQWEIEIQRSNQDRLYDGTPEG